MERGRIGISVEYDRKNSEEKRAAVKRKIKEIRTKLKNPFLQAAIAAKLMGSFAIWMIWSYRPDLFQTIISVVQQLFLIAVLLIATATLMGAAVFSFIAGYLWWTRERESKMRHVIGRFGEGRKR
ncbi:MAG TPA: hypothetical protein VK255_00435 [Patescibacteria group bacterium]|nr:hypothetical protein [Patescibacteria group bacterium]HLP48845.1 hypothetical protein [Candidatus Kapabacteria bacterium]